MSTTEQKALTLAERLVENAEIDAAEGCNPDVIKLELDAAAELRRLSAENEAVRAQVEAHSWPEWAEATCEIIREDYGPDGLKTPKELRDFFAAWDAENKALKAQVEALTRPAVPEGWQELAARVMDALAECQERTNTAYPAHAKCYPQWVSSARHLRWYAEMFRTGKPIGNGAGDRKVLDALAAAPQPEVQAWNVPDTAPKDGRLLRLLVEFEDGNLEDNDQPQETIGHNSLDNTGLDEWQFAGWNWTHDCYTEGTGKVLGWLPMRDAASLPEAQPTEAAQPTNSTTETWLRTKYGAYRGHPEWRALEVAFNAGMAAAQKGGA